jgi:hypothetical protein
MPRLDLNAQGQLFAEVVLPPDMAARRPVTAVDWQETCVCLSGHSPLPPLLQGFARGSTSLQVLNDAAAALSWLRFLTSQSIVLTKASADPVSTSTGSRRYDVIIHTPVHDPADHLLTIKVQVNGSRFVSMPQTVSLTPGACEHSYSMVVDEALGRCAAVIVLANVMRQLPLRRPLSEIMTLHAA